MAKSEIPVETLIEQLHGADWTARCDAARLLGQSRDPRAVDALLPDLNDPDWRVRRNAAQALGSLRDPRAVEPLLQALKDRTMTVRQRAIVALGRIKDPRALPALLDVLLENKQESYEASKAIKKFGKKTLPEVAKAFERSNNNELRMLLIEMKYQGALDLILKLLESHELSDRLTAISELGKLGDKKAIPYLMNQLNKDDPFLQGETVRALGKLGDIESIPVLLDLLTDDELYGPRIDVYHAVTEAFQDFGGVSEEIKNAFPGNYPAMFNMAGAPFTLPEAIGFLGTSPAENMLKKMFSELQSASQGQVKLPFGIPSGLINKVFDDIFWKFGVMFADAKDARQERVKRLTELLKSEAPLTRAAAALSLPWYSDEGCLSALEQAAGDTDETVRKTANWALQALQKVILYRRQTGL